MIILDPRRLQALRLAAGLSARDLARQASMDYAALNRLESEGVTAGCVVTLKQFLEIANALGASPDDLLTDSQQRSPQPHGAEDDAKALAALLWELGRQPVSALADSLGWTAERTLAAADQVDATFQPLGLEVHRRSGRLHLKPKSRNHEAALLRARRHPRILFSNRLVTPNRARLVARATREPLAPNRLSAGDRKDVSTLLIAGALDVGPDGRYVPSEAALFALFPEGAPKRERHM